MDVVDFVVVGAPNAGVGALARLIGDHPQLALPRAERASVFVDAGRYVFGPEWFEPGFFPSKGAEALRGMISPGHMSGFFGPATTPQTPQDVAAGMARTLPDAKLIAVLRDPLQRAIAHHRLTRARGLERRTLQRALTEQLSPGALPAARQRPREVTGYVVWGEYGRILQAYRDQYPHSQLLLLLSSELERDPQRALSQLSSFLGIEDSWAAHPEIADADDQRISPTELGGLLEMIQVALPDAPPKALRPTLERWNTSNELDTAALPRELRARLQAHYAADAEILEESCGIQTPWSEPPRPPRRRKRKQAADVAIVVLVHETPAEADTVLDSIVRNTSGSYELLLVDNGSSAAVAAVLAVLAETYGARRVRFDENLSFAAANNAAVRTTGAKEVLLLNSDTVVTECWLSNLRAALNSASDVALVGPRTNNLSSPQGGIWVDDSSPAGIERFGRFFNYSDPTRWVDVSMFPGATVSGFCMLARRTAWDAAGGFDENIPWYGGEDEELSKLLMRSGWRLLYAGDTYIYHAGHRSFWLTGANRTAHRFGVEAIKAAHGASEEARLVRDVRGLVFELHDGIASHVETGEVVRMVRAGRQITAVGDAELATLPVGPPIYPCRARGTEQAWVLHSGHRRRVIGDKNRVRRLPGLSMVEPHELAVLPQGPDVAVEEAFPPLPEVRPRLRSNPAEISVDRLVSVERVSAEIAGALQAGRGFSLIRLDVDETLLLNEGMWPADNGVLDLVRIGVREDPGAAAAALRQAIVAADAVGVVSSRDQFAGAPMLEQLLFHFDLYPQLRCSSRINEELLAVDPIRGSVGPSSRLLKLLRGRPVALVGPVALVDWAYWQRRDELENLGLEVSLAVHLDDTRDLDAAFLELAAHRERFDAVLVIGDIPVKSLCSRLGSELEVVALDLGHALDRTLHPRYIAGAPQLNTSHYISEYLREMSRPVPPPHELDGKLVRVRGQSSVSYVERGHTRALISKSLLELFAEAPLEITREEHDSLPRGLPLFAVHERYTGTFILIDGQKRPLQIGLPFTVSDDALTTLPVDNRPIHWYPDAGPGLTGRKR